MNELIACVTGASGMVGRRICEKLASRGYKVRALSRQKHPNEKNIEFFSGDILNEKDMLAFMQGAGLFFHCAAELENESRMWPVNVQGTENILKCAGKSGIIYLCHLSSVGVTGAINSKLVDETTPCNPQNAYEKSKWAAEQLVARGMRGCKVVILRPTDVIDERKPGILALAKRSSFMDLCKVFVKGAECAHIVHADDVAAAALHFISYPLEAPQCYIVSCDNEPLNTIAGVWSLYKSFRQKKGSDDLRLVPHLPLLIPYILRKILRGKSNMGDTRYSSQKLIETGFTYKFGLKETVNRVASISGPA